MEHIAFQRFNLANPLMSGLVSAFVAPDVWRDQVRPKDSLATRSGLAPPLYKGGGLAVAGSSYFVSPKPFSADSDAAIADNTGAFTIACLCAFTNTTSAFVCAEGYAAGSNGYLLGIRVNDTVSGQIAYWGRRSGTSVNIGSGAGANDGKPKLAIAVTRSDADHEFFVNGKSAGTSTSDLNNAAVVDSLTVGGTYRNSAFSSGFTGTIYYVLRWNRALSADEIAALSSDPYCLWRDHRPPIIGPTNPATITTSFAGAIANAQKPLAREFKLAHQTAVCQHLELGDSNESQTWFKDSIFSGYWVGLHNALAEHFTCVGGRICGAYSNNGNSGADFYGAQLNSTPSNMSAINFRAIVGTDDAGAIARSFALNEPAYTETNAGAGVDDFAIYDYTWIGMMSCLPAASTTGTSSTVFLARTAASDNYALGDIKTTGYRVAVNVYVPAGDGILKLCSHPHGVNTPLGTQTLLADDGEQNVVLTCVANVSTANRNLTANIVGTDGSTGEAYVNYCQFRKPASFAAGFAVSPFWVRGSSGPFGLINTWQYIFQNNPLAFQTLFKFLRDQDIGRVCCVLGFSHLTNDATRSGLSWTYDSGTQVFTQNGAANNTVAGWAQNVSSAIELAYDEWINSGGDGDDFFAVIWPYHRDQQQATSATYITDAYAAMDAIAADGLHPSHARILVVKPDYLYTDAEHLYLDWYNRWPGNSPHASTPGFDDIMSRGVQAIMNAAAAGDGSGDGSGSGGAQKTLIFGMLRPSLRRLGKA